MNSKSIAALVTFFVGGCVVSSDEEMDAVEVDAVESIHPAPPTDNAGDQLGSRVVPDYRPPRDQPDTPLQPCFEEGAGCKGEFVCTDTKWGLYCMHPQPPPVQLLQE